MSDIDRVLFTLAISVLSSAIALPLGYAWTRAMHYPFTLRQRRMWTLYVLVISAAAVMAPVFVAMYRLWKVSLNQSATVTIVVLVVWTALSYFMVLRMSRRGEGSSKE
jgi:hypothetical protein